MKRWCAGVLARVNAGETETQSESRTPVTLPKLRFLGQLVEPHKVAQQDPDDECDDHRHDEGLLLRHEDLLPNVD